MLKLHNSFPTSCQHDILYCKVTGTFLLITHTHTVNAATIGCLNPAVPLVSKELMLYVKKKIWSEWLTSPYVSGWFASSRMGNTFLFNIPVNISNLTSAYLVVHRAWSNHWTWHSCCSPGFGIAIRLSLWGGVQCRLISHGLLPVLSLGVYWSYLINFLRKKTSIVIILELLWYFFLFFHAFKLSYVECLYHHR